jgi:ribosome biogenesis GTPase / thiamine phosphate phosphatase
MNLLDLGFNDFWEDVDTGNFELARVFSIYNQYYMVATATINYSAEVSGRLQYKCRSKADLPTVGDWVLISIHDEIAVIHDVLLRKTLLARKAVTKKVDLQLIAANLDVAFIVQGMDRDFNLNRLDRYLAIVNYGEVEPVVILNKKDLCSTAEVAEKIAQVHERHPGLMVLATSFLDNGSIENIQKIMMPRKTYGFIGSSGVGKSTIINHFIESEKIQTQELSDVTNKGKHTTTNRHMYVLKSGSLVIDTPGMRELGLVNEEDDLKQVFELIKEIAVDCKFNDCIHDKEPGCAVKLAVDEGRLTSSEIDSYVKLKKEEARFSATKLELKEKDKKFGKMCKQVMKSKKDKKR